MMINQQSCNGSWFGVHDWQREGAIRLLGLYSDKVRRHIFPAFSTIEDEALHHEGVAFEALRVGSDPAEVDEAALAERAKDLATAHFTELDQALQGVVNGAIANLYHFGWESPVREWLRRSNHLSASQRRKVDSGEFAKLVAVVKSFGWTAPASIMADINELRLVANTVKHNRGTSARELFACRRELFFPFNRLGPDEHIEYEPDGADLIPTEADFTRYVDALCAYWAALPTADPGF